MKRILLIWTLLAVFLAGGETSWAYLSPDLTTPLIPDPLYLNSLRSKGTDPNIELFSVNGIIQAQAYGAACDALQVLDGGMLSTSAVVTSATGEFTTTPSIVGKTICVDGAAAGGAVTCGTISSVTSSTSLTASFTNTSGGNLTNARVVWGTDDTAHIQAALDAASYPNPWSTVALSLPTKVSVDSDLPAGRGCLISSLLKMNGSPSFAAGSQNVANLIGSWGANSYLETALFCPACSGPMVQYNGISGQNSGAKLLGISFSGNATYTGPEVLVQNLDGLSLTDDAFYHQPAGIAVELLNSNFTGSQAGFTERVQGQRLNVDATVGQAWTYVVGSGGGTSFQGSGCINCVFVSTTTGTPLVNIGSTAVVYNAPWTDTRLVTGCSWPTTTCVAFANSGAIALLEGDINTENAMTMATGNEIFLAGHVSAFTSVYAGVMRFWGKQSVEGTEGTNGGRTFNVNPPSKLLPSFNALGVVPMITNGAYPSDNSIAIPDFAYPQASAFVFVDLESVSGDYHQSYVLHAFNYTAAAAIDIDNSYLITDTNNWGIPTFNLDISGNLHIQNTNWPTSGANEVLLRAWVHPLTGRSVY